MKGAWVSEGTLTLPYGTLRTLHYGVSEVRVKVNTVTQTKQVCKLVSLLGREDTLAVNEAVFLREIDHPNVAGVFDVAEVAGTDRALACYEIIMPFYEKGSVLDALAKRGERFAVGQARDVAVRALRGLAHLHDEFRILHRDVKPGNLFLADDGSIVKIGDFGEAIRMDQAGTGSPLLTPQFWSPPETFTGGRYTAASDVYSLGMSLAEMLSGPFPYEEYTREDLGVRLSQGRPALLPRHLEFQFHVPRTLRRIVRKAIKPNPRQRFTSAEAMLRALLQADFIDWSWPHVSADLLESRGHWRGNEYRVVGRPVRGAGWRIRAERLGASGWRKLPQVDVVDHEDQDEAARSVFRQIDRHVVNV